MINIALESIDIPKLITEIPNGFVRIVLFKKLKFLKYKKFNELPSRTANHIEVIFEEGTEIIFKNAFQKCAKLER